MNLLVKLLFVGKYFVYAVIFSSIFSLKVYATTDLEHCKLSFE